MVRVFCALFVLVTFIVEIIEPSTPFVRTGALSVTQEISITKTGGCATIQCQTQKAQPAARDLTATAAYHSAELQIGFDLVMLVSRPIFQISSTNSYQPPDLELPKNPPRSQLPS